MGEPDGAVERIELRAGLVVVVRFEGRAGGWYRGRIVSVRNSAHPVARVRFFDGSSFDVNRENLMHDKPLAHHTRGGPVPPRDRDLADTARDAKVARKA